MGLSGKKGLGDNPDNLKEAGIQQKSPQEKIMLPKLKCHP